VSGVFKEGLNVFFRHLCYLWFHKVIEVLRHFGLNKRCILLGRCHQERTLDQLLRVRVGVDEGERFVVEFIDEVGEV
jgi:hypothetical protein